MNAPALPAGQIVVANAKRVTPQERLAQLAVAANEAHAGFVDGMRKSLAYAIQAGEALIEARATVRHGEWYAWLEKNFGGSAEHARRYIILAGDQKALESNHTRVCDLSLRGALKLIDAKRKADGDDSPRTDPLSEPGDEAALAVPPPPPATFSIDQVMDRVKDAIKSIWEKCPPEYRGVIPFRIISLAEEIQAKGELPW